MNDTGYRKMIEKVAKRIGKETIKELRLTAEAVADDPEVEKYLKNLDVSGATKLRMRRLYIQGDLYNELGNYLEENVET